MGTVLGRRATAAASQWSRCTWVTSTPSSRPMTASSSAWSSGSSTSGMRALDAAFATGSSVPAALSIGSTSRRRPPYSRSSVACLSNRSRIAPARSIHDEEPSPRRRRRAVRRRPVRHLVAHPGGEREAPPIGELGAELALETEDDMALLAPMIRDVARRVLHHAHPHVAQLPRAPARDAGGARMLGDRHRAPVGRLERDVAYLHRASDDAFRFVPRSRRTSADSVLVAGARLQTPDHQHLVHVARHRPDGPGLDAVALEAPPPVEPLRPLVAVDDGEQDAPDTDAARLIEQCAHDRIPHTGAAGFGPHVHPPEQRTMIEPCPREPREPADTLQHAVHVCADDMLTREALR